MDSDLHPGQGQVGLFISAVDSTGATIDFLLSAKRDAAAAERFLAKALGGENHPAPRVINTDEHLGYPSAIVQLKTEGALEGTANIARCNISTTFWNRIIERSSAGYAQASIFGRSQGAWRTIAGYEAIHMIRKGQACGSAPAARVGLLHRFIFGLFSAAAV